MKKLAVWFRSNWLILLFVGSLGLFFFIFRTRPTEGIASLPELEANFGTGQPVILEFYSNL
jgi:hypothetical protein